MKRTNQSAHRNLIGQRIRRIRLAAKPPVTQDDLAGRLAALGVTIDQTAVSRIESRNRYLMDYEVAAIARALKVPVAALFGDSPLISVTGPSTRHSTQARPARFAFLPSSVE